ncbi:nuclear transport factor 2 family protein [Winogradskyella sp. UBA3174]|uniref:nuclear transport factor 2 family protein n=1 Tax=Winogradskyella sp. UBA3174 TaxID=1947785 RepID=UPI0025F95CAD|nr:nuclear transport factor 2 family protein [Winogradskyella sp. UBA3174]|tara:strand:- start:1918 stop:3192 length:1275 start_codon:yes stop_codon:yes gene_type:complete
MKSYFIILFSLITTISFSQSNTEIFLFDLEIKNSKIELSKAKNISNNKGYDNQPSFYDDRYIVFASTRNDQTDIAKYDTRYKAKIWMNFTEGGEYSPLKIPNKNEASAVRLDNDGKQRLYSYNWSNGESTELIQDLVVAYYTWYDENTIVSAIIEEENLNLYVHNIQEGTNRKYATNVGRSFHKIPNSNLVSFISKEDDKQWQIKSLNPLTGRIRVLANTMEGVEDICWLNNRTILSGKENILYKLTLRKDNNWKNIADLSTDGITKITRMSTNNSYNKLLIAGDINSAEETIEDPNSDTETITDDSYTAESLTEPSELENIVQKQLDAYNSRDIDAFMATYTKDIKLYNYPNTILSEGQEQMRKDYISWFKRSPDLKAVIKNRIVIGNKVIDEEEVTANGQTFNAVAIYEVENGLISKVTFLR